MAQSVVDDIMSKFSRLNVFCDVTFVKHGQICDLEIML